jgi:hypothetical protein
MLRCDENFNECDGTPELNRTTLLVITLLALRCTLIQLCVQQIVLHVAIRAQYKLVVSAVAYRVPMLTVSCSDCSYQEYCLTCIEIACHAAVLSAEAMHITTAEQASCNIQHRQQPLKHVASLMRVCCISLHC